MKNLLFILSFLCSISIVYGQFTQIPDAVFENFLEQNGMGDGINNNGQVLTANIENVTSLNIPSLTGVSDMTGIEDFLSIRFLNFSRNPVNSIDLSQNSELRILGTAFTPLTVLDLSQNNELEQLACQGGFLTTLLLNSPNLTIIECFENFITALNLSQCPSLESIDCDINQISNLDISNNLELDYLRCSSNNLTTLDTSNNINLRYVIAARNNFVNLDFSQNINLEGLLAPYNPNLTTLDMRNGFNQNIGTGGSFNVFGTNALECILVDDADADYLQFWFKDDFTTFVNNEQECANLSISESSSETFIFYPNPATNILHIETESLGKYILSDVNGNIIKTGNLNEGISTISVDNLASGIYVVKLSVDNKFETIKFLKN